MADRSPSIPESIGGYKIIEELGRGGMGVVYKGENKTLGQKVAIKTLLERFWDNDKAHSRFLIEARAMARIESDHVVTILGADQQDGVPFFVMKFLNGQSLENFLEENPNRSFERILEIAKEIAQGLANAHAQDVVHRDIKPANVFLEKSKGRVKILDFGLARIADELAGLTETDEVLGTPYYMAPEQISRTAGQIENRTDLFSLGVVLYEMVTGERPFTGDRIQILFAISTVNPPPLSHVKPDTPPELSELVRELMEKKPENRPASALAVVERLTAIIAAQGRRSVPRIEEIEDDNVQTKLIVPPRPTDVQLQLPVFVVPPIRTPGEVIEIEVGERRGKPIMMKFCWIPPSDGRVMIGSPEDGAAVLIALNQHVSGQHDPAWFEGEAEREIEIGKGFYLSKFQVTQEEFECLVANNPSYFNPNQVDVMRANIRDTSRFPVEMVSWSKAAFFANRLSQKHFDKGWTFSLPTEEQWEYACRGGKGNQQAFYFGNILNGNQANCKGVHPFGTQSIGPNLRRTTAVGIYETAFPHPWGLCDMHGNVFEWCKDWYDFRHEHRVVRGGSWNFSSFNCRAAERRDSPQESGADHIGFRLVLSVD